MVSLKLISFIKTLIIRFTNSEYYNITILERENSLKYGRGRNPGRLIFGFMVDSGSGKVSTYKACPQPTNWKKDNIGF